MVKHIGSTRRILEKATGNVYQIDFIIDTKSSFGFHSVVSNQYKDRDIVCDNQSKVFRPEEVEFVDEITTESWYRILEQLKELGNQ